MKINSSNYVYLYIQDNTSTFFIVSFSALNFFTDPDVRA